MEIPGGKLPGGYPYIRLKEGVHGALGPHKGYVRLAGGRGKSPT